MKYLVAILLLTNLIYCTSDYEKSRNDALGIVDSLQRAKLDSVKVKEDSITSFHLKEQNKIIADINFGISEKRFKQLSDKYYKTNDDKIGNFGFVRMEGYYYNKKLYEVDFISPSGEYYNFDNEVAPQVSELRKVISAKYGPSTYGDGLLQGYDMHEGHSYLVDGWSVGTKEIQIKINVSNARYYVNLEIFQLPIRQLLNKEYERKRDSTTTKASSTI